VRPGDFTLGSSQSRAAARMLLEQSVKARKRFEIVLGCRASDVHGVHASEWRNDSKGEKLVRIISIPSGMTLVEGLNALGGYSQTELVSAAKFHPETVEIGSMLTISR
jgi:hypothetical protein